jgi:uncharacterized protein (DUF433 family)
VVPVYQLIVAMALTAGTAVVLAVSPRPSTGALLIADHRVRVRDVIGYQA